MKIKNLGYAALIAVAAGAVVLGSTGYSEAKGKKKAAAPPPPPPIICTWQYKPVCATKGGLKFTYSNACWAAKDGAKVVSQGACKAKKAMKPGKKMAPKKAAKPAMKKEMKKK